MTLPRQVNRGAWILVGSSQQLQEAEEGVCEN